MLRTHGKRPKLWTTSRKCVSGITVDKCRETIKDYGIENVENFSEQDVLKYIVWIASGNYNDENN